MRLVMAVLCVVGVLIGVAGGLTAGYTLWGHEAVEVATLRGELEKTRSWLLDEITWSDERCDNLQAALARAQADLTQARRELARSRAILEQSFDNVRPDLDAREGSEATRRTSAR